VVVVVVVVVVVAAAATVIVVVVVVVVVVGVNRPYNRNIVHVECNNKSGTNNKRGNWNHLKIIQKIPEQHTRKHKIKELQKTAILGTAHILWKVLMKSTKHPTWEITLPVP
jgi:hypothetical protein